MRVRVIKRLDLYILQNFALVFAGAFFICLFVFMMQFTWRYVNELIGKGLSLDILAQFFGYMALTLVPQSLPMVVLLASLIAFGNMGERLELLAMKAAGVPLIRIMRPYWWWSSCSSPRRSTSRTPFPRRRSCNSARCLSV